MMSHTRKALAVALSEEILDLLEDVYEDEDGADFDKLLADIDTRIQEYRI